MGELYVLARTVLLDALEALGTHRDAIILVGAQAVYQHIGDGDLAVAPYTTDADLAINPARLEEIPPLELLLRNAGFAPKTNETVGVWIAYRPTYQNPKTPVAVDLLVPQSVSPGRGRRAAKLPGHHSNAARIVEGLEGTLVDADVMTLSSFQAEDRRTFEVLVAGPAGLLVAKLYKIRDRSSTSRESDKDALDIYRILRAVNTEALAARYRLILSDSRSNQIAEAALSLLAQQFTTPAAIGIEMLLRAVGPLADRQEVIASCRILTGDLLRALEE